MVGRVCELVQLQRYVDSHLVSVVRILIEQVVTPVFDEQDLVTVDACAFGTGLVMCVALERSHVAYMCRDVSCNVLRLRLP